MTSSLTRAATIVLWVAMLSSAGPAAGQMVVKPGDDLQEAIVRARGGPQPRVLELAAGRHALSRTLVLAEADSGLTLQGPADGDAAIVGSVALDGWKKVAGREGVFEAPLPESLRTSPPRHLYHDGRMLRRARTPNDGWLESPGTLATTAPFTLAIPPAHPVATWNTDDAIWIIGLQKWAGFKFPVTAIDAGDNSVRLNGTLHAHRQEKMNRFWIENEPAALDAAGEWRVDPRRGVIQIVSATGQPPAPGSIAVPILSELVRVEHCHDVTLRRIRFCEADDDFPSAGEVDGQAAAARRGAMRVVGARHITISECAFGGLGGYAIDFGRGSRECRVDRCTIGHLGARGVRIGETRPEEDPAAVVTGHVVEGCDVHDYGRTHLGAVGLILFHASHVRLVRNEVHHGNYTAVSAGWTWGYKDSPCHHNLVEENLLHHVGNDLLSDMGGVYLLGPQPGTIVRRNRIHDVFCHDYGGWGSTPTKGRPGCSSRRTSFGTANRPGSISTTVVTTRCETT
jgi:hypothetical protein